MSRSASMSRREFVTQTASTAACAALASSQPFASLAVSGELLNLSAHEAIGLMLRGDLSAERYAGELLAQAERGKSLNAFINLNSEKVLEAARAADLSRRNGGKPGRLHGLPIPVKDSINTKDYPTTGGTNALRQFTPTEDAPLIRTLTSAGAIVMGKTNLHELSFGWTSNNLAFGAVHNPYDATRIPGGSSGGTAAAVAARMAPLGIAEDTQGSIRVPAALCGLVGLRPSTYRYSTAGVVPISPLFDQTGPHARCMLDIVLFDAAVTGDPSPVTGRSLKGVKLGIDRKYWFTGLDPEVERVTNDALRKLQSAGVQFVEEQVSELAQLIDLTTGPVQTHDVLVSLKKYLADFQTGITFDQLIAQLSPDVKGDFVHDVLPGGPGFITDTQYQKIVEVHLPRLKQQFRDYFMRTGVDAIVFPATMVPATRIGEDKTVTIVGKTIPFDVAIARNISPGSTAALPGLVLPAGLTSGMLPIALEFDGPAGTDRALLALGLSFEQVLGTLPAPKV